MWKIAIDTGGTFTDCIGRDPNGRIHRVKILSSSRLRGTLRGRLSENKFLFSQNWQIQEDIFGGYTLFITGNPNSACLIERINFSKQEIELDRNPLPCSENVESVVFEITAFEEAPVLAARILTLTPLSQTLPPIELRLGSTKGTNALLEKTGADVALLITKGFKDLLYIGTQQRPHLFQLNIPEPEILHKVVIEVEERIESNGNVLFHLTEAETKKIVQALHQAKIKSVAVALMHSWHNPVHELILRDVLVNNGFNFVSISNALMPGIKILPRAQTSLVNAYLDPVLHDYLQNINSAVLPNVYLNKQYNDSESASAIRIMTSAGGLIQTNHFRAKDSLLSGPAGGVVGAAAIAKSLGFSRVITLDMGGTSTDTARYDGGHDYEYFTKIGGITMLSPCLAIESVAAGGGSVCSFDGSRLTVGPESTGAIPGPACYGAGGPLAITDINLLLGKIDSSAMGIPIDRTAAEKALHSIKKNVLETTGIDYSNEQLLQGFVKIANEKMADAIRKISVSKGFDPQDYALLVFGGAGGLHGCQLADLLGITSVILPYDSGLLSAYGIGMAEIERFAHQQILKNLTDCKMQLAAIIDDCTKAATEELLKESIEPSQVELRSVMLYLRFRGQDSTIELTFRTENLAAGIECIEEMFEKKYRDLFGHFPVRAVVEVESVKVVVSNKTQASSELLHPASGKKKVLNQGAVIWDNLNEGDYAYGPFILINSTSTAFIEKGWKMLVSKGKNIVLNKSKKGTKAPGPYSERFQESGFNPIELELFTNRFGSIAEEMGAQLKRTAFSVNIKERLDFSCAILDQNAELLVNAPHIPVHLGSLGICARLVLQNFDLRPGDVIITNHPKYGGSHLPDVTLIKAAYLYEDSLGKTPENPLIGYVINRAHHAEIGGTRPGSMPPDATSLIEEGVVIAPFYLVREGILDLQGIEQLLVKTAYPTRALQENLADINAALSALRTGERKLKSLVSEFSLERVRLYMTKIKETAAEALKLALSPFGKSSFRAMEKLDDGHMIAVQIHLDNKADKLLTFDFSGSSAVHPNNLNANISIVYSAVLYVLRILCNKEIPLNDGLMKHVAIELPQSSFLHPQFSDLPELCPAVVGGNTEVSQRIVDTLLKALEPVTKVACSQGTMNNFLFGNEKFGYYETIGGGAGAGLGFNGRSAVHQHMTNTKITDPEELEFRYPVRLERFEIRQGSGGLGVWQGGDGIIREFTFLEPADMTIISQHRDELPYGINGGKPGKKGEQYVIRCNGKREELKGVDSLRIEEGDRMVIETPGGGGAGTPE